MDSSFRLIRIRGIDIGVNWSWLLIFALILWSLSTSLFPVAYPGLDQSTYWTMGVTSGVLFVVSLLLHELGHAFRAQKEGMEIDGITLWLFGGVARFKGMFPTAGAEFRIAIAGPLVTVVLAGIFFGAWYAASQLGAPPEITGVPDYLWQINVFLLAFNMIPALPLDGGRILRSALWQRKRSFAAATVSAARISRVIAGGMIAVGVLMFFRSFGQGLWVAFIGWFVLQAGRSEVQFALFRQTLAGRTVRELMTLAPETVSPLMSVTDFIETVAVRGHSTYPVVDPFGRPVGMVSLRLAGDVPPDKRDGATVADVMVPIDAIPQFSPDDDLTQVAPRLQAGPGRALVVERGQIAGVLSMADVARAIEVEQIRHPAERPPPRRGLWVLVGIGALVLIGFLYTPPFVVTAPGEAFDVTKDIKVDGIDTSKVEGEYVLTSVAVQQPNVFGLIDALVRGRDVLPMGNVIPRDVDQEEFFESQERLFEETQQVAAAAAAEAAGLEVKLNGNGAHVSSVNTGSPAAEVIETDDVIVEVDGEKVELADELSRAIRARPAGTKFELVVVRDGKRRNIDIRSREGIVEGAPGIGVFIDTKDFEIDLPFTVEFKKREIGGPSAGLTYALAVYDLIEDADIARDRVVATTGTIDLEGNVGRIGGLEEKAEAAKEAKADLFLVPKGDLSTVDRSELKMIGVTTLKEALAELRKGA